MNYRFERCLEEGKIVRIEKDKRIMQKEIDSAKYDLRMAEESLERKDFKWSIIKAYYSMFHAAKALLFSKGYREKTHFCLMIAVKELFVNTGKIEEKYLKNFREAMILREEADYEFKFSEDGAIETVENAKEFLNRIEDILREEL